MDYLDELTEEDYQIAESNGIHRKLAKFRYEQGGFERDRAITQPVRTLDNHWSKWKDTAEKNGVKYPTFYARLNQLESTWTPEQAATTPPAKPGDELMRRKRTIPDELIKRAAENGISNATLYQRLFRYKMDEETAVNKPTKGARKIWR